MKKEFDFNESIHEIADFYGYEAQARQTMEECGELITALNKQWRLDEFGGTDVGTKTKKAQAYANVVSEIADVGVMLAQLIYLLDCENDVVQVMDDKVQRQLQRIEESMKVGADNGSVAKP